MGKVSPVSSKYIIRAQIHVDGTVDRPDVIGAIFGQTEGLLGTELELRELQKSGKVGRIEVNIDVNNGKTSGSIIIPVSLDQAETAIIGASMETIERIGPCNSKVTIEKIEDVRVSKRDFVIMRAKELLKQFQSQVMPDSQEITEEVARSVRVMEICTWGPEKLPAGPGVEESEEIIIVEGRADVLNLLKNGFKNAIAINGTSIPESIKKLCKQKEVTVFVDGDRGGDLIVRELMAMTDVDFVTKAPDGKELEELTKKEIHLALRSRITAEQFKHELATKRPSTNHLNKRPMPSPEPYQPQTRPVQQPIIARRASTALNKKNKDVFKEMLEGLVGTRGAYLLDKDLNVLGKVPTSELQGTLKDLNNIDAVVFDGTISRPIAKTAEISNVHYLVGMDSQVQQKETPVTLITSADLQ